MLSLLQALQPRFENKGSIIYDELEEINEVIFNMKGIVDVGF